MSRARVRRRLLAGLRYEQRILDGLEYRWQLDSVTRLSDRLPVAQRWVP